MNTITRLASRLTVVMIIIGSSVSAASDSSASVCARACLKKFVDDYADAMLAKNATAVPLAANARITENAREIKLGEGVWATAQKFFSTASQTQYVADPVTGQVARMGIIDDGGKPKFWTVRLKVANDRITEVETLVAGDEQMPFQPEGYLWREAPFIREVPARIRSDRQQLLRTAGTYWTIATTTHKGSDVPYSVDCIHVENGMNTDWERPLDNVEAMQPEQNPVSDFDGRIWTCAREVNLTTRTFAAVRGLRYLVDEERGLVMAWNIVDKTQGARAGSPMPAPPGVTRSAPEYGPPSRGPDGWPAQRGGGPGAASGPTPSLYHAALVRIVNGKIHREQFFQVNVPVGTASPY